MIYMALYFIYCMKRLSRDTFCDIPVTNYVLFKGTGN